MYKSIPFLRSHTTLVPWLLLALAPFAIQAETTTPAAGTIQSVTGTAMIYQAGGTSAYASAQTPIQEGDTIKTSKGEVELIMADKSSYTVYPDSQFIVKAYRYEPESSANDRSIIELITGKFRFATGLIGKRNAKRVQYISGVATMGIRGTAGTIGQINNHYEVTVSEGEVTVICAHTSCTRQGEFSVLAGKSAYFKLTTEGDLKQIPVQDYWQAVSPYIPLALPEPSIESVASPH